MSAAGQLESLAVHLDITHTYIGDLIVELRSPDNISVLLHNRGSGPADNLIRTYSSINSSVLQALRGASIHGDWTLKVADRAGLDQGKLNYWALKLTPM